jgi:hypothetical protein
MFTYKKPVTKNAVVEISQNVPLHLRLHATFSRLHLDLKIFCNYKTKFQLFWSFSQL